MFGLILHLIIILGATCSSEMYSCDGNRCISPDFLCNGRNDCVDGSDEKENCLGKECKRARCIFWISSYERLQILSNSILYNILVENHYITDSSDICDIPFEFKGQKYASCIDVDNGGIPWCYTNTSNKEWNTCNASYSKWTG